MSGDDARLTAWLDAVRDGRLTMSQRALATVERQGGVEAAVRLARERGVHLVRLTDDRGAVLLAASPHPFETLC